MSEFPEQIYHHTTASVTRAWRERRGRYLLEGSRCKDCGTVDFPRRTICAKCGSRNIEPYKHPTTGNQNIPRISTVIELDDGVKILAEVTDTDYDKIVPGKRVEMVLKKLHRESNST